MNQDMFGSRGRGRGGGGGGRGFGARGASRGFRGGDRGGRGGFRGGDRGRGGSANFVRSDHGDRGGRGAGRGWGGGRGRGAPFRGNSSRGGESSANRGRVVMGPGPIKYGRGGSSTGERGNRGGQKKSGTKEYLRFEIKAGLQLYITFKSDPVVAELEKLPGFHSITTPHSDKEIIRIILFRDIESLEAARAILDAHENVVSTDHMGLKSSKKQPDAIEKRQVYLRLGKSYSEDAVKQLDSKIEEILPLRENSCKVQYATVEEAEAAVERLKSKIGQNGLQHVDVPYIVQSAKLAIASLQQNQVVLRDVPKSVTLKDIASVFPDGVSFALFDKTFPASKFCHAAIRFKSPTRVAEILKSNDMKIAGKKVYIFPAYMEFLHEYEQLGEAIPEEPAKEVKVKKEEPPAKKRKVENPFADKEAVDEDANGDDEEDSDDEEEGDEEEDDDDDDNEEEEDEEDDEEGEEAAEEEESDESD